MSQTGCTVALSAAGGMLTPANPRAVVSLDSLRKGERVLITSTDSTRAMGWWRGLEDAGDMRSLVVRDPRTRADMRYNPLYVQRVDRLDYTRRR
ncbi:MAG TPA: hypothetical protein VD948_06025, partial [Rhodothermales bacterium]|nr:hypothetical protein [Rhodothermales bacterium]